MELAGLSLAQAVFKVHPIQQGRNILVLAGPGNNGRLKHTLQAIPWEARR